MSIRDMAARSRRRVRVTLAPGRTFKAQLVSQTLRGKLAAGKPPERRERSGES
ncbi:MAG TPA: hypothetical protein VKB88_08190 [Bryobacteraceae bacterium]|nr:hypothetical protein [Bryobacteraceae bacterium]